MIRKSIMLTAILFVSLMSKAQADIITSLVGNVSMQPVPITLDHPDAVTNINGMLHVVGSHDGRPAREIINLATRTSGGVEYFSTLAGSSNTSGFVREVKQLGNGQVLYVGDSAGTLSTIQPTSWLHPISPKGGVGPDGSVVGGSFFGLSNNGRMVGSINSAIYGMHDELPSFLPNSGVVAVEVSADGQFNVGSYIWNANILGGYDVFDTSGFDFSNSGGIPTWKATEFDPVLSTAVFAGEYLNPSTFENEVGFWNQDGTFRFSTGAGSFTDFEIFDGQLVAAINGLDDSSLWALTDGSSLTLGSILGEKTLIYDDGLFVGSVGFAGSNASGGSFVASFSAVPEPGSCLLFGIGFALVGLKRRRSN